MKNLIIIVLAVLFFSGCEERSCQQNKFNVGDFVESKLNKQRGQILSYSCYRGYDYYTYHVRLYSPSTKTFDGSVSETTQFSLVSFVEFELEKEKSE